MTQRPADEGHRFPVEVAAAAIAAAVYLLIRQPCKVPAVRPIEGLSILTPPGLIFGFFRVEICLDIGPGRLHGQAAAGLLPGPLQESGPLRHCLPVGRPGIEVLLLEAVSLTIFGVFRRPPGVFTLVIVLVSAVCLAASQISIDILSYSI